MDDALMYAAAFITLIAVAVAAAIITVRRDGRGTGDLIKQLIIWVSIAALLPLTSYAGATVIHPSTRLKDLQAQRQRVQAETYDTKDVDARGTSRDREEAIRKQIEDEERAIHRAMFWIGAPVGFAALVTGFFLRPVAVGTGLAFGGLCTLTSGCYSYWDDMGDWLRFGSLLIVLATVIVIGLRQVNRPTSVVVV